MPKLLRIKSKKHSLYIITLLFILVISSPIPPDPTDKSSCSYTPPFDNQVPKRRFSSDTQFPKSQNMSLPAKEGARKVITILVYFPGTNYTKSKGEMHEMVYSQMDQYWREVSYGKIWIEGDVTDWLKLDRSLAYYGEDMGMIDANGLQLIRDAIYKANPWVDFTKYEYVVIIHSGYGQESSHNTFDIWSAHYFSIYPQIFVDSIPITSASIAPEMEKGGVSLGVVAHEFGHALGLPDLYDTNYIDPGHFVDGWGLMGSGSSNGNPTGSMPPHLMMWCKIKLGWITNDQIITVNNGEYSNVTLDPSELKSNGYQAIKVPLSDGRYYLVETRQKIGFDLGLPNYGVLISPI